MELDKKLDLLKQTELFILDMDGTFYLGDIIIDGALEFLEEVSRHGKRYIFFTNNSSKSPKQYVQKLSKMNCIIEESQIMTSGDVTAHYLNSYHKGKNVYLLGTPDLENNFKQKGILLSDENVDIVVVGFDMTLTYEKLQKACSYIQNGAMFIATHPDINCPTDTGDIPDCGAICAAIQLSTGVQPKYLGKPSPETIEMILNVTGAKREKTVFVGDRLYTDIAAGVKNGAKGALVLSGETKKEHIHLSPVKPDAIYESLKEMKQLLKS